MGMGKPPTDLYKHQTHHSPQPPTSSPSRLVSFHLPTADQIHYSTVIDMSLHRDYNHKADNLFPSFYIATLEAVDRRRTRDLR